MSDKTLVPNFFSQFSCTGSQCRSTCCSGWEIGISKNAYLNAQKYKKSTELQKIFDIAYKRNKKSVDDNFYAQIQLTKDNLCPLLSDDMLCRLQVECGHEALCPTCKVFPRMYSFVSGNTLECSLSPACEEVTRLLIEQKNAILFENVDDFPITSDMRRIINTSVPNKINNYYWDIKTLCIAVLQADEYSLRDRLLILGVTIKSVSEMDKSKVPAYVNSLLESDDLDFLVDSFKDIEVNTQFAIGEFLDLITPFLNDSSIKNIRDIFSVYDDTIENVTARLSEKRALFSQFCSQYPRALENLLLSVITGYGLPFYDGNIDIWKGFVYIVMLYNAYKYTIIATMEENISLNSIVDAVVNISRHLVHNPKYRDLLIGSYVDNDSYSLAHMAMIIKG